MIPFKDVCYKQTMLDHIQCSSGEEKRFGARVYLTGSPLFGPDRSPYFSLVMKTGSTLIGLGRPTVGKSLFLIGNKRKRYYSHWLAEHHSHWWRGGLLSPGHKLLCSCRQNN